LIEAAEDSGFTMVEDNSNKAKTEKKRAGQQV